MGLKEEVDAKLTQIPVRILKRAVYKRYGITS